MKAILETCKVWTDENGNRVKELRSNEEGIIVYLFDKEKDTEMTYRIEYDDNGKKLRQISEGTLKAENVRCIFEFDDEGRFKSMEKFVDERLVQKHTFKGDAYDRTVTIDNFDEEKLISETEKKVSVVKEWNFLIRKMSENDFTLLEYIGKDDEVVYIPDNVTEIFGFAFANENHPNTKIRKIVMPSSVRIVRKKAFSFCKNLSEVVWSQNCLLSVELGCFDDCSLLSDNDIPSDVEKIDSLQIKKTKTRSTFLERLVIIHKAIKSSEYPNKNDLQTLCETKLGIDVSLSTISRDLDFLRNDPKFFAPIEYDYTNKGFYYTKPFELKLG